MSMNLDILGSARSAYANRREPERLRPLASIYWRMMTTIAIIIVVAATSWGFLELIDSLAALSKIAAPDSAQPQVLNRTQLEGTLTSFDSRQARFEALKKGGTPVADPSR